MFNDVSLAAKVARIEHLEAEIDLLILLAFRLIVIA